MYYVYIVVDYELFVGGIGSGVLYVVFESCGKMGKGVVWYFQFNVIDVYGCKDIGNYKRVAVLVYCVEGFLVVF